MPTDGGMSFTQDDPMTLPWAERRLIVVQRDDAVKVVRRAATHDVGSNGLTKMLDAVTSVGFGPVVRAAGGRTAGIGAIAAIGGLGLVGAGLVGAVHLWKMRKRASSAHLPFLVVTSSQAKSLTFAPGHPVPNVVYVGDPCVAGKYYPVANFHHFMFEGKVVEAIRLLRSLRATEISVEYLEGFDQAGNIDFSIVTSIGDVGEVGSGRTGKARSGANISMQLSPTMPAHVPADLIWFASEPMWQEVAAARLESGLRTFAIKVNYTEDFGIDSKLTAKIEGVGLKLGGKFTDYKETSWALSGSFAEDLPPNANSEDSTRSIGRRHGG